MEVKDMSRPSHPHAHQVSEIAEGEAQGDALDAEAEKTLELRAEQVIAHKDLRDLWMVEVRTEMDAIPGRLEVGAYREEVVVEHEAVGEVVSERDNPWEENGVLIIPIYEEQLVVTKRLVLRERMRVRRVGTTQRQLFQDSLRRERLVVDDPQHTGMVREQYPAGRAAEASEEGAEQADSDSAVDNGFLGHVMRKVLE
jgi:uncharacterized protein (TIGR02271 family)